MQLWVAAPASPPPVVTQAKPTAQVLVAPQQAWPAPPQTPQVPALPAPRPLQLSPAVVHVPFAQHVSPEPPHALQVPGIPAAAPVHTPPVWQMLPAQQAALSAPQLMQVRAMPPPGFAQARPPLQVAFAQQA